SLLAGLGVLTTIAPYRPPNLVGLVFDNQAYLSPRHGDIETATAYGTDLAGISRAAGVTNTREVSDIEDAQAGLDEAWSKPGPWVIVAKVDHSDRTDPARQVERGVDIIESALRFRRALRQDLADRTTARGGGNR